MTDQQLDEIAARAAHLHEYAQQTGEGDQLAGTDVPALIETIRRLRAELAAARTAALTEGAAAIDHLRATMLAPPVADLYATGLSGAAGELRRLAAALAEESHVVADDSDDPEHIDDCPGYTPAVLPSSGA